MSESRTIAADQKRLRRSVGEIVFTRLGGDPSGEEQTADVRRKKPRRCRNMLARADSATNVAVAPLDFSGGESPWSR